MSAEKKAAASAAVAPVRSNPKKQMAYGKLDAAGFAAIMHTHVRSSQRMADLMRDYKRKTEKEWTEIDSRRVQQLALKFRKECEDALERTKEEQRWIEDSPNRLE